MPISPKLTKHSKLNILEYFNPIRKGMCPLSNLSLRKDGHGFDALWIYDTSNTKPSVNTYTWTVTYQ